LLEAASFRTVKGRESSESKLKRALEETQDAMKVLSGAQLHPQAVDHLERAQDLVQAALESSSRHKLIQEAIQQLQDARKEIIE
jgi:hypothetical protein